MKHDGWPLDLRNSGNCGMELDIKPDGRKIEIQPTYFEQIPRNQKDFKRLNQELRAWEKQNKRIWI